MKTKTKSLIKIILLSFFTLASVNAFAIWSSPSGAPTGNNTPAPINAGTSTQQKFGGLVVGGFRVLSPGVAIFDNNVIMGANGTPNASAVLDLTSTTKGFLGPRMTTTQRNAIASPASGLLVYNTSNSQYEYYNGSAWSGVSSSPAGNPWTKTGTNVYLTTSTDTVGIGIASPTKTLSVVGAMNFYTSSNVRGIVGPPTWDTSYIAMQNGTIAESAANTAIAQNTSGDTFVNAASGRTLSLKINNTSILTVLGSNSNVGIGTATPGTKLEVNGTTKTTGFQLGNSATAGHVLIADANGVGTWQGVGASGAMTNPMTNVGDIIYASVAGSPATPARLASGTAGYVLTSGGVNTAPSWAPISGGGWNDDGTVVRLTTATDDVGIGTTSPSKQLDITESFELPHTSSSAIGVIYKDVAGTSTRFIHNYDDGVAGTRNNTFLGLDAGNFTTTGNGRNTGLGYRTLTSIGTGVDNTAVGWESMRQNSTGSSNTAIGRSTLDANTSGGGNTAIGMTALFQNSTGTNNTALGNGALYKVTTGSHNTGIGTSADVATGGGALTNATAVGYSASVNASNKVRIGNNTVSVIEGQVSWSVSSDLNLKQDVTNSDLGLSFINSLRPVSFRWRTEPGGPLNYGFIAQEVETALAGRTAYMVPSTLDAYGMKTMRYDDLIAPMVKAIQELNTENTVLKTRVTNLETSVSALTTAVDSVCRSVPC